MQNSLAKRTFFSRIQSLEHDEQEFGYHGPKKFIKKSLQIEIPDINANENIPPPIPSLCPTSSKFVFSSLKAVSSGKASTSTPTRHSDTTPHKRESLNFFSETITKYDDYYAEEEFFDVTMKKCHRKNMEDRATFEKLLDIKSKASFFGIYDGHRNTYASNFLKKNLHKCILNHSDFLEHPEMALKEAYLRLDKEICKTQEKFNIQGGSTALCAVLNSDTLHIANVGDCKAVLVRKGEPLNLNIEHRASNNEEKLNVEKRGGFVFEKKGRASVRYMVQGSLELTRSIGDQAYKQYISCEPDIAEFKLTEEDEYLILGSDGFWNEVNEREAVELVKRYHLPSGLSKFMVEEALKDKNYHVDNITLIVINLKDYFQFRKMINGN